MLGHVSLRMYWIYFFAALHLARRAFVAALIFANPAAEIRRLPVLIGTTLWPFAFAQRAFCAAEIFARADALILRGPRDLPRPSNPPRAVIAVSSAFNCPAIFALSSFNCEMMSIVRPRGEDCNRVLRYSGPSAANRTVQSKRGLREFHFRA
jgi:hypothetical protein